MSKAEKVLTEVGVLEDGESLLLLSHLLARQSNRLLCPQLLPPECEHFLVDL